MNGLLIIFWYFLDKFRYLKEHPFGTRIEKVNEHLLIICRKLKRQQMVTDGTDTTDTISDNVKEKSSSSSVGQETSIDDLRMQQEQLRFSKTPEDLKISLNLIPDGKCG